MKERNEDPRHPCTECGLRYSSYCIGCTMRPFGIGQMKIPEQKVHHHKKEKENE